jgi:hypothetical protein
MDYKKVAKSVKLCGSRHGIVQCKLWCIFFAGNDMNKCIPKMTEDAATAITDLLSRAEAAEASQETLQRAMAEYKARAEKAERERDAAVKELNGVASAVDDLADFIDEQIHPLVQYDMYLALRENADSISIWQYESEWRGQKEE